MIKGVKNMQISKINNYNIYSNNTNIKTKNTPSFQSLKFDDRTCLNKELVEPLKKAISSNHYIKELSEKYKKDLFVTLRANKDYSNNYTAGAIIDVFGHESMSFEGNSKKGFFEAINNLKSNIEDNMKEKSLKTILDIIRIQ